MENKIIELNYPHKLFNLIKSYVSRIPSQDNVYNAVEYFERNIFLKSKNKIMDKSIKEKVLLRDIINLHNREGIKDISQIRPMTEKIRSGEDILQKNKLPNVKLVKTKNNEFVLFDGHHSMLAYMFAGKKYLHEIPHLIIEDVSDKEVHVFFGEHSIKLKGKNWRGYVINWQASEQLCRRIQNNIGELFDSIFS